MTDDSQNMRGSHPHSAQLISPRVLLAACGHDAGTFQAISAVFVRRVPEDLAHARRAFERQDAAQLREFAHRLAGTLSAFSTRTGALASELEDLADAAALAEAGRTLDALDARAQELIAAVSRLTFPALQQLSAMERERERETT